MNAHDNLATVSLVCCSQEYCDGKDTV